MPGKSSCSVEIDEVFEGSPAALAGVMPGDRIFEINGNRVKDVIDLMYYGNDECVELKIKRGSDKKVLNLRADEHGSGNIGISLKPLSVKTCRNNCIFCFVSQLPKGLRRSLYVKDEDYRMSFLYGNYITLTNISEADKKRIVEQRLSPLYISVHATETSVRNRMLGNPKAADVLKELKFFARSKIRMHAQVVLCPGFNDGKILQKTIADLYKMYPYVVSIAVVPVGITEHRKKALRPVDRDDALAALDIINRLQQRFRRKHGEHIVFAADELYIKAGQPIPPLKEYDELHQIENGVGLVAQFISQSRKVKMPEAKSGRRYIAVTGTSFYPFLNKFGDRIKKQGFNLDVLAVQNFLFGKGVTVAGLLTGRDIIRALAGNVSKSDTVIIPDIMLKEGDKVFLDDLSVKDIGEMLNTKIAVIRSEPEALVNFISEKK
ncbi:MAG: DUF512 domain-containing protein [Dissulfurispiraceae bacterium]|jgi:putative radical SAM enzyme (TIGR03279 family)|nr:DUF512 domain-containing protein [Dissulfurispiraceae bacterium]